MNNEHYISSGSVISLQWSVLQM